MRFMYRQRSAIKTRESSEMTMNHTDSSLLRREKWYPSTRQSSSSSWSNLWTSTCFRMCLSFVLGCCLTAILLLRKDFSILKNVLQPSATTECLISFGTYKGQEYQSKDTVRISQCLVESKFLKIQQHQVQFAGKSVILDWLWIDYHERINVLVQGISADKNTFFHVFEQTKYALEDRLSMAIVGGIVEPGEQPMDAARREVQEEMQMECQEMVFLGRFRTDVNRGMGWTNGFLAKGCSKATNHKLHKESEEKEEEVGVADTEQQDLKTITLQELRKLVQEGQFLEIQWTAIVSLAILHLQDNTP